VEDCEITQCGHMAANLHFGANIVFRRVNMHDNSYGVHMGVKGNSAARGVLFEDCNADRNTEDRSDGFMAEGFCSGIVFVRCRASGNKDGAWDVKCPHARWYDCVASKSGKGFKVWYPPFYFENCLSYANGSGWQLARETADLVNCTIANCGSAIDLLVNGSLVNCIVYKSGLPAGISNQIRCENNLAFECGKGDLGLGFKVVDPGFVDPAKNDYHLAKDSPAIDAGVKEGASDHDLDGKPRPAGKGIDVGVYESQ